MTELQPYNPNKTYTRRGLLGLVGKGVLVAAAGTALGSGASRKASEAEVQTAHDRTVEARKELEAEIARQREAVNAVCVENVDAVLYMFASLEDKKGITTNPRIDEAGKKIGYSIGRTSGEKVRHGTSVDYVTHALDVAATLKDRKQLLSLTLIDGIEDAETGEPGGAGGREIVLEGNGTPEQVKSFEAFMKLLQSGKVSKILEAMTSLLYIEDPETGDRNRLYDLHALSTINMDGTEEESMSDFDTNPDIRKSIFESVAYGGSD